MPHRTKKRPAVARLAMPAAVALVATAALAGLLLASAHAARPAPDVVMNTIDPVATRAADGGRVRVSGPIGCTAQRIRLVVRIDQAATGASARGRWGGRCSGVVQHWAVRAKARSDARFADGHARVRASALDGRHRWSRRVEVETRGFPRRKPPIRAVGLGALVLSAAGGVSARVTNYIGNNTAIDGQATSRHGGALVRVGGPIDCSKGQRISLRVTVTQAATEARARGRWTNRCTGAVQDWRARARMHGETRFEPGQVKACAVAKTRAADRITDRKRWCERGVRLRRVSRASPGEGSPATGVLMGRTPNRSA